MSGHSKWSTIKRKKGAADARRGQLFTKYANAIAVAARDGTDADTNFKLKLAIDRARTVNLPLSNIEKAIARGAGKSGESQLEEVTYEGYGPAGVAVLVVCATDNRNRTAAAIRSVFTKHGGNLASAGSVSYKFALKGLVQIGGDDLEAASLRAIDLGAEEVEEEGQILNIYTVSHELAKIREALTGEGWQVESAELSYVPTQTVRVSDTDTAERILKLMDGLEELDDVSAVYSNFDIPVEILESLAT